MNSKLLLVLLTIAGISLEGQAVESRTPTELVDALNGVFGKQASGVRAIHAKGIDLVGSFQPVDAGWSVSKAPHFRVRVPITVRFSNFAGIPTVPDSDGLAVPRGMSIKFHLPDGSDTDIVAHSYNGFPTATADEFRDFLIALASPAGLEAFLVGHPIAKTFLENQIPPPVSYATVSYFGVNTFKFTNLKGTVAFGRYQIRPVEGDQSLSKDEAAKADPNYLSSELAQQVKRETVKFRLLLQIAGPGDRLEDPSVASPESRTNIELGTIEIERTVTDNAAAERQLLFLPGALQAGIERTIR